MANESGDTKLLGNFSKLIESVSLNPDYNPANPALPAPALNTTKTAALAAVADVGTKEAAFKAVVNDRQYLFEGVPALITRSGNMLKASGASKKILDDAKTVARKITGQRKTPKVKDDPNTPENEATKTHSVSQQSYEIDADFIKTQHDKYSDFEATVVMVDPLGDGGPDRVMCERQRDEDGDNTSYPNYSRVLNKLREFRSPSKTGNLIGNKLKVGLIDMYPTMAVLLVDADLYVYFYTMPEGETAPC